MNDDDMMMMDGKASVDEGRMNVSLLVSVDLDLLVSECDALVMEKKRSFILNAQR